MQSETRKAKFATWDIRRTLQQSFCFIQNCNQRDVLLFRYTYLQYRLNLYPQRCLKVFWSTGFGKMGASRQGILSIVLCGNSRTPQIERYCLDPSLPFFSLPLSSSKCCTIARFTNHSCGISELLVQTRWASLFGFPLYNIALECIFVV